MSDRSQINDVTKGMPRKAVTSMIGAPDEEITMGDVLNMAAGFVVSESSLGVLQGVQLWIYQINGKEWKVFFENDLVSHFERPV